MKAVKAMLSLAVFVLSATASTSALAWRHGGHARFGVYIGAPAYWYPPYYYPPYYAPYYPGYYNPPVVVAPPAPPVYIERGDAQPASTQSAGEWWYYCADTKAYYPYVKECALEWQRVAPEPPINR